MKRGKQTCRILKDIRRQIAEANDIEFITSECQYQVDCLGTCPKCEAEVRYLEQQLERKRMAGKAITVLGISAGLITMSPMSSCSSGNKGARQEVTSETSSNSHIMGESEPSYLKDTIATPSDENLIEGDIEEIIEGETTGDDNIDTTAIFTTLGYIPPIVNNMPTTEENDSIDAYEVVPVMPEFPGGLQALTQFIFNNIKYPTESQSDVRAGRVIIQFIVDKEGDVIHPKVVRGVAPYLDKEGLRIVDLMPKWKPGELDNGTKVNVRFTIPVVFRPQ